MAPCSFTAGWRSLGFPCLSMAGGWLCGCMAELGLHPVLLMLEDGLSFGLLQSCMCFFGLRSVICLLNSWGCFFSGG